MLQYFHSHFSYRLSLEQILTYLLFQESNALPFTFSFEYHIRCLSLNVLFLYPRMSLQDFKTHFDNLILCKLTPDLMSQEDGKKWMSSLQYGKWVKGVTAGGRLRTYKGKALSRDMRF